MRRGVVIAISGCLALVAQPGLAQTATGPATPVPPLPTPPTPAVDFPIAATPSDRGVPQILVVDFTRAMETSLLGQQLLRALEAEGEAIAAENREIEAELIQEELALTEQRATLEAAAFRELANAFDTKVQTLRAAQDAKERAFTAKREETPRLFHQAVLPILQEIMLETGGSIVLDRRVAVAFLSSVDVTDIAVARLDAAVQSQPQTESDSALDSPDEAASEADAPSDDTPAASDD
ncbi:MAG: OmpH family outer membrane protein [Pelagimonas sp.]|jgi:Skp family chaperone for outer membrane proteins|nr:OmpH family outer membrane protein [Pelagimonas sp.]